MVRRSFGWSVLLGAAILCNSASAETVLTVSSWVPHSHAIVADMIVPWGKQIEAETQGRVKLRILPKPIAGAPEHLDAVRNGLIDVAFITHGLTPGRFLLTQVTEFPLLGSTAEAVSVSYQRIHDKYLAKFNEHEGVIPLSLWTHGPAHIFVTTRQINKLADFEGLKIRVSGGAATDLSRSMGITSLLKPAPESYELLSTGVADGIFFPEEAVCAFRLDTIIKYATFVPTGLYNVSFALIMNPAKLNQLSAEDQQTIKKLSGENFARRAGKAWDASDARCHKKLIEEGVSITTASPELTAEIDEKAKPVIKAWSDRVMSKYGISGEEVLAAHRKEIEALQPK